MLLHKSKKGTAQTRGGTAQFVQFPRLKKRLDFTFNIHFKVHLGMLSHHSVLKIKFYSWISDKIRS